MKLQNDATERNLFKEHVVKDNWKDNRVDFVVKTVEIFRYKMILGQLFQLDLWCKQISYECVQPSHNTAALPSTNTVLNMSAKLREVPWINECKKEVYQREGTSNVVSLSLRLS